jgi:aldose 1-epimerase
MPAIEQISWSSDALQVTVLPEIGCRVHRLRAFGVDLLRTPADPATHRDDPFFWGAYVMAPWTNRVSARAMMVVGREVHLPANFHDGSAIHGQVHDRTWERTGESTFAIRCDGGDGWPWAYEVGTAVAVAGTTVRLEYVLRNDAGAPMPAGIGLHPWFRRELRVGLHAACSIARNDEREADPTPVVGDLVLAVDRPLAGGLDATWLDLDPPTVELAWPELGLAGTLRIRSSGRTHVAVASPDGTEAVAVEAVTNLPWALDRRTEGRPGAIELLEPGAELTLDVELDFRRGGERAGRSTRGYG